VDFSANFFSHVSVLLSIQLESKELLVKSFHLNAFVFNSLDSHVHIFEVTARIIRVLYKEAFRRNNPAVVGALLYSLFEWEIDQELHELRAIDRLLMLQDSFALRFRNNLGICIHQVKCQTTDVVFVGTSQYKVCRALVKGILNRFLKDRCPFGYKGRKIQKNFFFRIDAQRTVLFVIEIH
jgi:hypothetical protein